MGEILIRPAQWDDLPHILRQRRAMFVEIGWKDEAQLDAMEKATEIYLRDALPEGRYRAWVAETESGKVVSGGGVAIVPWPGSPDFPAAHRGWILGIYTEADYRGRGRVPRIRFASTCRNIVDGQEQARCQKDTKRQV